MKKTMLTAAALAALLPQAAAPDLAAGGGEPPAAPEAPVTEPKADAGEPQAEETPSAEPEFKAQVDELTAKVTELQALADDSVAKLAEAETKIKALTESLEASEASKIVLTASAADLKEIVTSQIAKMRTGLSLASVDMSKWTFEAVVTEFNSTSESFMKTLPVGSVVPKEEAQPVAAPVVSTSVDAAGYQNLGF